MRHLVQKQLFNISAPSLSLAQQWESRAGNMLRNVITPCIEQCFNRFASEDEVILLNRMEVDLGILSTGISDQQIKEKVEAAVTAALNGLVPASYTSAATDPAKPSGAGKQGQESFRNRRLSRHEAMLECFIHFLVHGTLPWWAEPNKMNRMEWNDDWIGQLSAPQYKQIIDTLRRWKHSRLRLVQQFSVSFIEKLLERYDPERIHKAGLGWSWMEAASGACSPALRKVYWEYWASQCIKEDIDVTQLIAALTYWLDDHPALKKKLITTILSTSPVERKRAIPAGAVALKELLTKALAGAQQKKYPGLPAAEQRGDEHTPGIPAATGHPREESAVKGDKTSSAQTAGIKNTTGDDRPESAVDADAGGLYAEAAGLVLLHPFLPELFRTADLWHVEGWATEAAQHTAVLLVTWLAYGHTDLPEYNLIIPKLLCGMPWEETLDVTLPLEDHHRQSGTALLEAVIDHWNVLGNTSADGLREGFLLRTGKVEEKKDGWLITVERKAQDVLIAKLPWGISMIRLPWLQNTGLYVDWA